MKSLFTRDTFRYFDTAKKNKIKKEWFAKNREWWEESVRDPFQLLLRELDHRIGRRVPGVIISERKLSRPMRPKGKEKPLGWAKASANFFLTEPQTSIYEWNPGIYMQLGDEKIDNVIGMGLYGPSSRQIKRLRAAFVQEWETVDELLADRKLRKYWGTLADEKYIRFPKDYSPEQAGAKYLWYKQFFLRRHFTRKEVLSREFPELVLRSFEAGVPLLQWVRGAVGTYNRLEMAREKREREAQQLGW